MSRVGSLLEELQLKAAVGRQRDEEEGLHEEEVRQSLHFLTPDPTRSLVWLWGLLQLSHWDATPRLRLAKGSRDFPGQSVHPSQETALFIPAAIPKPYFHTRLPSCIPKPLLQGWGQHCTPQKY